MATINQASVQSLFIELRFDGLVLSTATAFVVATRSGPHLITNRHNFTGRHQVTEKLLSKTGGIPNEVSIQHNAKGRIGEWTQVVEPLLENGLPLWKEHPFFGSKADFVALPITQPPHIELYPYDPGDPGAPLQLGPADPVSVIGFPFGKSAGGFLSIWVTGFLASEPEINYNGLPALLIDCRSRQGQSGSPVIAHRNGGMLPTIGGGSSGFMSPVSRFIGIYSGRIHEESDIGIVWKAYSIQQIILSL